MNQLGAEDRGGHPPMANFAVESVITELAAKIGMDPVALRLKNAAKQGTKSSYGPTYPRIGLIETLGSQAFLAQIPNIKGIFWQGSDWFNKARSSLTSCSETKDSLACCIEGDEEKGEYEDEEELKYKKYFKKVRAVQRMIRFLTYSEKEFLNDCNLYSDIFMFI